MPPPFAMIYGTAWKEDATERCVLAALDAGFRAIDTANQRKHYYEEGVGRALAKRALARSDLFVQTKFTFRDGQDHRLPYDEAARVEAQVAQSFESSLSHLGLDHIDSLILHGPSRREGLGAADREAWRAMEAIADSGRARSIGLSNVTAKQVSDFVAFARIAPTWVQNRCYAERGWDRAVRDVCRDNGIVYQGFSLLTANRAALAAEPIRSVAARHGKTAAQIVFCFARQIGMLPLTGTKDPAHMAEDLESLDLELSAAELTKIEAG